MLEPQNFLFFSSALWNISDESFVHIINALFISPTSIVILSLVLKACSLNLASLNLAIFIWCVLVLIIQCWHWKCRQFAINICECWLRYGHQFLKHYSRSCCECNLFNVHSLCHQLNLLKAKLLRTQRHCSFVCLWNYLLLPSFELLLTKIDGLLSSLSSMVMASLNCFSLWNSNF